MLGTNFRDYAIVFTQLEAQEEAFSTVELYSECTGLRPLPPASSHRPETTGPGPAPASRAPPPHAHPLPAPVPAGGGGWGLHVAKSLGLRGVACISQLLKAQMQPDFGFKVYSPSSTPSCLQQRRQVREGNFLN